MSIAVTSDRLAKAQALVRRGGQRVGMNGLLDLLEELKWFDWAYYGEDGRFKLKPMTDVQVVAFAAAMTAWLEAEPRG